MDAPQKGFDAAIHERSHDHLNRWPFAREIYGIASRGHKDWSVRIGIYGEWGSGKTSVLRFTESMAEKDDHIVIWFNPWAFTSKTELWRHFVLQVFETIEKKLGGLTQAGNARRKGWLEKIAAVTQSLGSAAAGVASEHAGDAVNSGLGHLRKHMSFGPEDLKELQDALAKRKVFVLIDDLDRTAAELVPEILFALKELMDIPSFCFVAAFDPGVVTEVLGKYHPGFGTGLKFLEKIIDYPRWLPPATVEGLTSLALSEEKQTCDIVPEQELRDVIALLPANPRAVRQFIRLLALLQPQIERHREDELQWPVILAANVLKVRHPQLAHPLLSDDAFWRAWGALTIGLQREKENPGERDELLKKHIAEVRARQNVSLDPNGEAEVFHALHKVCTAGGVSRILNPDLFFYQLEIAEAPAAVTRKEFDAFDIEWRGAPTKQTAAAWISKHSKIVERHEEEVYRELLRLAVAQFAAVLNRADNVVAESDRASKVEQAKALFSLIQILLLDLGRLDQSEKWTGKAQLEEMSETFASITNASAPIHTTFREPIEKLLTNVIEKWSGDCTPLIEIFEPYAHFHSGQFGQGNAIALLQKLSAPLTLKFGRQVLESFREPGFVARCFDDSRKGTYAVRRVLLDPIGALWGRHGQEMAAMLAEAANNPTIQQNAYDLLYWCDDVLAERHETETTQHVKQLFKNPLSAELLWKAATATPLSPAATARLSRVPEQFKKFGNSVELPKWWDDMMKQSGFAADGKPADSSDAGEDPGQSEEPPPPEA